jgi:RHS repeat-associated protein
VYIAGGSGSTSIGARWGNYSGGIPQAGYNAELLSGGLVKLWRVSDWTQLGSYQISGYSNGTWYTLTLRANGSSLSVDVNGVTRITATDSAFSSGEAGLWSYASTAVSQHRFDDFVITVLGGGRAPGGRLFAPEQGTGLFERLSDLIREVVNHIRNVPMKASLSAPPAGQTWKTYYSAGGQLVAMRVLTATGNTLYYLHSDHLGSTSLTTDSSGNVTARQNYYPYGQIRPGGSGTMPTDIGFTGQRAHDSSLGSLMFFQARYYSPAVGRFLSADSIVPGTDDGSGGGAAIMGHDKNTRLVSLTPDFHEFAAQVGEENRLLDQYGPFFKWDAKVRKEHPIPMGPSSPQALNRYSYALNNSLRYTDPSGHFWWLVNLAAGLVGAVASAVGSVVGQLATTGQVDVGDVVIAAGTGFVAGFVAPASVPAAMATNAAANMTQYALTRLNHGQSIEPVGLALSGATGALAGRFAGPVPHPDTSKLLLSSSYGYLDDAAVRAFNTPLQVAPIVAASNFARTAAAAIVANLPVPNLSDRQGGR